MPGEVTVNSTARAACAQRAANTNLCAFKPPVVDVWHAWKRELHGCRCLVHNCFPCPASESHIWFHL